jgi:predicted O-linked N-acetylglucosamine transferase (SPINDLY family)
MLLNYLPDADADKVLEEHREWGRIIQARISPLDPIELDRDPLRRLRVGYLSPDFREHSVASFIEPVLKLHDRSRFEVWCYSNLPLPDDTTTRIKAAVDGWRDVDKLSDGETARLIREDRIDILVDLSGHTANSRLAVLAARPALVQMTWLGYPNTTGLRTIDYRITDWVADPAGEDAYYSEELLRLEGCFLCYRPDPNTPEVAPLPALKSGHVTFGSFNNFSKINPGVLQLWAEVLKQVPGSRLLLKCPALTDTTVRDRVSAALQALGIGAERVELLGHTPTRQEHLALYAGVDIALDTFPYNGTTTTCEALWMGVPVLSLAGKHHAGRVGAALLNAAGLADWLADTPESFVAIAQTMAADVTGLARLRGSLRGQLADSPLCDAADFVRRLEEAMLKVWAKRLQDVSPKA